MPDLDHNAIAAMARGGMTDRDIIALLGRAFTESERKVADKARAVAKLQRITKRGERSANGPMTGAEKKRAFDQRKRMIERRAVEDPGRRSRLEKTPSLWLRHYMPAAFNLEWSVGHRAMIDGAIKAAKTGTGVAVAAPRGEGKTTVLRGICLYLVATGQARFPVMAGWTHRAATESFRIWLRMLHSSPEFAADYPELCQPFEESTHSARIKGLLWDDGEPCGAEVRSTDKALVLPGNVGAIAAASVQGDVKGLNVTLPNGEVLRPDILLLDDAQDPSRAENPTFVADVIDAIEKQWMCLAGPTSRITTMVACTVAAKGDVSEHFLSREGFVSVRVPRVTSWPQEWTEKGSASKALWDAWHAVRLEGIGDGDGGVAGRKFYRSNKPAMTQGMEVSWIERFDRKRKDPDAMYSAMVDFYRIGETAFASEYQNEPIVQGVTVYNLTPAIIQSRIDQERAPGVVPEWARFVVIGMDLNPSYAFSWAAIAFGDHLTAAVIDYGLFDENPLPIHNDVTETARVKALDLAMERACNMFSRKPYAPRLCVIDAGGAQFDVAVGFANASIKRVGLKCIAAVGRAAKFYRPNESSKVRIMGPHCHISRDERRREWVPWHADAVREISQKAWTGSPGAPGSMTLPRGYHRDFAEQICREQLRAKGEVGGRMVWDWTIQPGPHDYADAVSMAFMGAEFEGLRTGDEVTVQRARKKYSQADLSAGR
jgi:hypothetical protein